MNLPIYNKFSSKILALDSKVESLGCKKKFFPAKTEAEIHACQKLAHQAEEKMKEDQEGQRADEQIVDLFTKKGEMQLVEKVRKKIKNLNRAEEELWKYLKEVELIFENKIYVFREFYTTSKLRKRDLVRLGGDFLYVLRRSYLPQGISFPPGKKALEFLLIKSVRENRSKKLKKFRFDSLKQEKVLNNLFLSLKVIVSQFYLSSEKIMKSFGFTIPVDETQSAALNIFRAFPRILNRTRQGMRCKINIKFPLWIFETLNRLYCSEPMKNLTPRVHISVREKIIGKMKDYQNAKEKFEVLAQEFPILQDLRKKLNIYYFFYFQKIQCERILEELRQKLQGEMQLSEKQNSLKLIKKTSSVNPDQVVKEIKKGKNIELNKNMNLLKKRKKHHFK